MGNTTEKNTGVSLGVKPWRKAIEARSVIECGGLGWGCTLIKAGVFCGAELQSKNGSGTDSDTHFAEHCRKNGHKQIAHFGILCGHKRSDGVVLYPGLAPDKPRQTGEIKITLVTIKALITFGGRITQDGGTMIVREGETVQVDKDLADMLVNAGQAAYA
jgi:hypothetical protein